MKKLNLIAIAIVLAAAAAVAQSGNYVAPPPSVLYGSGTGAIGIYATPGNEISQDSNLSDSGTALTYGGTNGIVSNGGFSSSGSSGTGGFKCGQGTEIAPAAGYVGVQCPATITTAFWFNLPGAPAGDTNNHWLISLKDGSGNEVLSFGTLSDVTGSELMTASGTLVQGDFCEFNSSFDCTDSSLLVSNIVSKAGTNVGAAAMTLNMSASTSSSAFVIPNIAGGTSGTTGALTYDTTAKNTHGTLNGSDALVVMESSALTANTIPKASSGTLSGIQASSLKDNGTVITSSEPAKLGNTQLLTSDSSGITATTAATGTVVFTWGALPVSTNFAFHCSGTYTQATAAGGVSIAVQGATNAPTRIDAWASLDSTNPASTNYTGTKAGLYDLTTTTATLVAAVTPGAAGTQYQWMLDGWVEVGASATTLNVIFFSGSSSDSVVIKAGSYCALHP
jgi:hypothetical protein